MSDKPAVAQQGWPDQIWVYKPVPKTSKKTTDRYDDHYWIRLVPSNSRWSYLHRKWKIWEGQVTAETMLIDREMCQVHNKKDYLHTPAAYETVSKEDRDMAKQTLDKAKLKLKTERD